MDVIGEMRGSWAFPGDRPTTCAHSHAQFGLEACHYAWRNERAPHRTFIARVRVPYRYHSLEDFLIGTVTHVDGQLDDGWGAVFPVKGREIEATVLFADISSFSRRTIDLTPAETLVFVNHLFAWVTAEALSGRPGIVDKYIGDELMVVFSKEFGSTDPFRDAVQGARAMSENDAWAFCPHIGIASGRVIVGYVGTPCIA